MKLSVVTTLYMSAPYIDEFYRRITAVSKQLADDDYEIIMVDDGSPDNSFEIASQVSANDSHVIIIELSRNFGHHHAMMTGIGYAKGEKIFLVDSDLEEDPEWLPEFDKQLNEEKCDVVYGVQKSRKGGWAERWFGEIYYSLLDMMLSIKHPRNITTARLMVRDYVNALLLHRERELVISGLWVAAGFRQHARIVNKKSSSTTTYSFARKLIHLVNTVTSFSSKPLIFIFITGMVIFLGSLVYASVLVINRIFFFRPLDGWTSIMVSLWFLGGIIISFLGVIGIYLSKIFLEIKQRPVIVKRIINGPKR